MAVAVVAVDVVVGAVVFCSELDAMATFCDQAPALVPGWKTAAFAERAGAEAERGAETEAETDVVAMVLARFIGGCACVCAGCICGAAGLAGETQTEAEAENERDRGRCHAEAEREVDAVGVCEGAIGELAGETALSEDRGDVAERGREATDVE